MAYVLHRFNVVLYSFTFDYLTHIHVSGMSPKVYTDIQRISSSTLRKRGVYLEGAAVVQKVCQL